MLPLLPGYAINLSRRESFPRPHTFAIRNGIRVINDAYIPLSSLPPPLPVVPDAAPMRKVKSGITQSNHVLRFYAYFKEAVPESSLEKWRVRKCVILFYLEDGSVQITESDELNSGLLYSGFALKRHRIPIAAGYLTVHHFAIGCNLMIYGRCLRINDADDWTKTWLKKNGFAQNAEAAISVPIDPFHQHRLKPNQQPCRSMFSISRIAETAKGKPTKAMLQRTKNMLNNMNTVLRFWAVLDTPNSAEESVFQVRFFVADETVEVVRDKGAALDFDISNMYLRRQPLPKIFVMSGAATIGTDESDNVNCYTASDFTIGSVIDVYGRHLRLIRADTFTKQYYKNTFGVDLHDLALPGKEPLKRPYEPAVPAPLSLALQDGRRALLSLPRAGPSFQMRFAASMQSNNVADQDRHFILMFDVGSDGLSVYEKAQPNSGFSGGKILERSSSRVNPATGNPFASTDFYVGAILTINGFKFRLDQADEATLRYMETNSVSFPSANLELIFRNLKEFLSNQRISSSTMFREMDVDRNCVITMDELSSFLKRLGWRISQHELMTIYRAFDRNGDGMINLQEFLRQL